MNLNLNNKYALVCGSTAGIGKATAMALAAEGVQITLIARNEEKLKATLAQLPQHRNHDYIVADFSNPKTLKEKVEAYVKQNHGFHILINNTGGPKGGPVFSADIEEFENAFTQHLKCNHVLAQAVVPFMKSEALWQNYKRHFNLCKTTIRWLRCKQHYSWCSSQLE